VGTSPWAAAYDDLNGYVYVSNRGSDDESIINGSTVISTLGVGTQPLFEAYDTGNGFVYVANYGSANVSVFNGTSLIGSVNVGSSPYLPIFDPSDGRVYVTNYASDNVSVINGTVLLGTVPVGSGPQVATYDHQDGDVYVLNTNSNNVSVINGTRVVGTVPVGSNPEYATFDGNNGYVYVANLASANVTVINGTKVVGSVGVGTEPVSATYDSDDGYVYVVNSPPLVNPGNVSVIDGTKVIGTVNVGGQPEYATYDSRDGFVFVMNLATSNVSEISGTSLIGSINVGWDPEFPAYDTGNGMVYVPNEGSDNVSVISPSITYNLTFSESGLPTGTAWSVSLNGTIQESTFTKIAFKVVGGDYPYAVGAVGGFVPVPSTGVVTVDGVDTSVSIAFEQAYNVTFSETGLPAGTNWSVTLGSTTHYSITQQIIFPEPDGTYSYAIGFVPGWATLITQGTLDVNGNPVAKALTWVHATASLNFTESGLPSGTNWSVIVTGTGSYQGFVSNYSTSASIQLAVPAFMTGFYDVNPVRGYAASPSNGSLILSGQPVNISITFSAPPPEQYVVSFSEIGLPIGAEWWVNITNGPSTSSSAGALAFNESNGSYTYSLSTVAKTYSSTGGTFIIRGFPFSQTVTFSRKASSSTYSVTFTESGLPNGSTWYATLNDVTEGGPGPMSFDGLVNGTYAFNVSSAEACSPTPSSGVVTVNGKAVNQSVVFSNCISIPPAGSSSPPTFLGLPLLEGLAVLGGIIVAVVAAATVIFLRSRRKESPPVELPPTPDSIAEEPRGAP
jgi:YVTN family beta-propeller protein